MSIPLRIWYLFLFFATGRFLRRHPDVTPEPLPLAVPSSVPPMVARSFRGDPSMTRSLLAAAAIECSPSLEVGAEEAPMVPCDEPPLCFEVKS